MGDHLKLTGVLLAAGNGANGLDGVNGSPASLSAAEGESGYASSHLIEVRKSGYVRFGTLLTLRKGKTESLRARLKPAKNVKDEYSPLADMVYEGKNAYSEDYIADLFFQMAELYGVGTLVVGYLLPTGPAREHQVIADEPTSGLDAAIKLQMISLLKDLKSPETTYLIISHDLGLVRRIATRIIVLLKGRIVEDFPASRLDEGFEHHPYTQRLMHAADLFDANGDRRAHKAPSVVEEGFLDGRTDAILNAEGCVYACDCQRGSDLNLIHRCAKERPPLVEVALGHRLACFAAAKEGMSTPDNAPSTDETLKEKV